MAKIIIVKFSVNFKNVLITLAGPCNVSEMIGNVIVNGE